MLLGAGRRAAFFSVGLFVCVFLFVFSVLFGLFSVPFWLWVLGALLLFFRWGFLGMFLFVFSLLFGLFFFFWQRWKIEKISRQNPYRNMSFSLCGNAPETLAERCCLPFVEMRFLNPPRG